MTRVSFEKKREHPLLGGWGDLKEDLLRLQRTIASADAIVRCRRSRSSFRSPQPPRSGCPRFFSNETRVMCVSFLA